MSPAKHAFMQVNPPFRAPTRHHSCGTPVGRCRPDSVAGGGRLQVGAGETSLGTSEVWAQGEPGCVGHELPGS